MAYPSTSPLDTTAAPIGHQLDRHRTLFDRIGTERERDCLGHFIDAFTPKDKATLCTVSIRIWREIQIWVAIEGAKNGNPWTCREIINQEIMNIMLKDRPRYSHAPWIYHNNASTIPEDYVGHVCIAGCWFHES